MKTIDKIDNILRKHSTPILDLRENSEYEFEVLIREHNKEDFSWELISELEESFAVRDYETTDSTKYGYCLSIKINDFDGLFEKVNAILFATGVDDVEDTDYDKTDDTLSITLGGDGVFNIGALMQINLLGFAYVSTEERENFGDDVTFFFKKF